MRKYLLNQPYRPDDILATQIKKKFNMILVLQFGLPQHPYGLNKTTTTKVTKKKKM